MTSAGALCDIGICLRVYAVRVCAFEYISLLLSIPLSVGFINTQVE